MRESASVDDLGGVDDAIARALRDGPGIGEQLLAGGQSVVVLDGDDIVRIDPSGHREVLSTL